MKALRRMVFLWRKKINKIRVPKSWNPSYEILKERTDSRTIQKTLCHRSVCGNHRSHSQPIRQMKPKIYYSKTLCRWYETAKWYGADAVNRDLWEMHLAITCLIKAHTHNGILKHEPSVLLCFLMYLCQHIEAHCNLLRSMKVDSQIFKHFLSKR